MTFLIGVVGGTASGKTSVCKGIMKALGDRRVCILSLDSFYKPLTQAQRDDIANYDFDHPDAFDWDLLESTLKKIKRREPVDIPSYNFVTHSRDKECSTISDYDVILFEGILAFVHESHRAMMDMKLFVDTDADLRLARRVLRDIAERGRDLEGILSQYERTVKPAFDKFVLPTKKYADVIIPRGAENVIAIDLIVKHIKQKLESLQQEKKN
mmetsp:Transcript_29279/g.50092  ORF Transcript_29279/g.50092 Transcript_29279/m.50092 type:complete len:212 (+) Transcript_29279:10-645(+)